MPIEYEGFDISPHQDGGGNSRYREAAQPWEAPLPRALDQGIQFIVGRMEGYNDLLEEKRPASHFEFTRRFLGSFFVDRITRAREVKTSAYREVAEFGRGQLPVPTYTILCVDGRVIPTYFGLTADVASSMRVEGGSPAGFSRNDQGEWELDPNSALAREVKTALLRSPTDSIAEVGDNHLDCTAGKLRARKKIHSQDDGLWVNVRQKREWFLALQRYVDHDEDLRGKRVISIQTSFNPTNRYMFMGLERDEAIDFGRENGGYTLENLHLLARQGKIISTEQLVHDPEDQRIIEEFNRRDFNLDWQSPYYVQSARRFWANIAEMKSSLLPIVKEKLVNVYSEPGSQQLEADELEERAMLVLLNAYSGFLNNLSVARPDYKPAKEHVLHPEHGIKASEGTYPPYKTQMFAVFIRDKEKLIKNISIAHGIVIDNRVTGRVLDTTGTTKTDKEFIEAPVPLIVKEIVRKDRPLTDDEWRVIAGTDFTDLPDHSWDTWTTPEFYEYLASKGIEIPDDIRRVITIHDVWKDEEFFRHLDKLKLKVPEIVQGMDNLRKDMALLYSDPETAEHLMENDLAVFPVLSDGTREPRLIMPFMRQGKKIFKLQPQDNVRRLAA